MLLYSYTPLHLSNIRYQRAGGIGGRESKGRGAIESSGGKRVKLRTWGGKHVFEREVWRGG